MIGAWLGPPISAEDSFVDADESVLLPAERESIARAVGKRRSEFTTVRACARVALARLGIAAVPILPGLRGAPTWPEGVVGSMTHCAGYRAAAVAWRRHVASIGIDAEPHEPLPDGVDRLVIRDEERRRVRDYTDQAPDIHWDRLIFSAKESVYKAWFPLTQRWLGFEEASVTFDPSTCRFEAELLVPGPEIDGVALSTFAGQFLVDRGLIVTSIVLAGIHGQESQITH